MSRASFIATVAALLICASTSRVIATDDAPPEEARAAEQRLLGTDEEATRFAACQPFTREIAVEGAVEESFDASLAAGWRAGGRECSRRGGPSPRPSTSAARWLPATVSISVMNRLFTAEGAPIGVGRVMWAEVVTRARGPIAIHRFRPPGGIERFWLANGEAATAPSMRLPLDAGDRLVGLRHARRSVRPAATARCERTSARRWAAPAGRPAA